MRQPSLWRSFGHAWAGLMFMLRTQRNARLHVIAAMIVTALGLWLELPLLQWALLAMVVGAVIAAETINTALEAIVDLLSPEYHERAKVAKDVAAGAVLILGLTAIIVGLLILGPPLWMRLSPVS